MWKNIVILFGDNSQRKTLKTLIALFEGFLFSVHLSFIAVFLRWQIANSVFANITAKIRAELITGRSEAIHFIVESD